MPALEEADSESAAEPQRLRPAATREDDAARAAFRHRLIERAQRAFVELQQGVVPDHLHQVDLEPAEVYAGEGLVGNAVQAAQIATLLHGVSDGEIGGEIRPHIADLNLEDDATAPAGGPRVVEFEEFRRLQRRQVDVDADRTNNAELLPGKPGEHVLVEPARQRPKDLRVSGEIEIWRNHRAQPIDRNVELVEFRSRPLTRIDRPDRLPLDHLR